MFCLWRHSLRSNLEGIDPEKLYLATFICQYALCCCKVWPSHLFVDDCFVKILATCDNYNERHRLSNQKKFVYLAEIGD